MYEEEKKKKEVQKKESSDSKRSKAKQDVELLLGKGDKKKKKGAAMDLQKKVFSEDISDIATFPAAQANNGKGLSVSAALAPIGLPGLADKKPLPGISSSQSLLQSSTIKQLQIKESSPQRSKPKVWYNIILFLQIFKTIISLGGCQSQGLQ